MEIQYRTNNTTIEPQENRISGYAVVYNSLSNPMSLGRYEFREQISPGAFDGLLDADIKCLFNHDSNQVLGRTTNNTLSLRSDDHGLYFECEIDPEISWQQDLLKSIKRGDINQCSFAFSMGKGSKESESTVETDEKVETIRTIEKVGKLYEVSVVTFPAYSETEAHARKNEEFVKEYEAKAEQAKEQQKQQDIDLLETMLML